MRLALAVIAFVLAGCSGVPANVAGCSGVPANAVRDWANPNFKHVVSLVDDKYATEETRLHSYQSLAALLCEADLADRKSPGESLACRCHHASSDDALKARCTEFVAQYR